MVPHGAVKLGFRWQYVEAKNGLLKEAHFGPMLIRRISVEMRPKTALIQLMNKIATTWQVFKANTGYDGKADKRGSQIRRIDDVFQLYDRDFGGGTQQKQIGLTMALYTECKDWLKKKQQKSDYKTGFLKVTTLNQNLADRRAAIGTVAKECLTELRSVAAISEQRETFNTRKIDMLARGKSGPRPVALSGGYGKEKESWDSSGKTAALAGTTVHGLARQAGTPFDDLSLKEYQRLAAQAGGANQVLYFKRSHRMALLVEIDPRAALQRESTVGLADGGPKLKIAGEFS